MSRQPITPPQSSSENKLPTSSYKLVVTALIIAIAALLVPAILRGSARLPFRSYLPLQAISPQALTASSLHTMSSTKLSPKELKEWNQYVHARIPSSISLQGHSQVRS